MFTYSTNPSLLRWGGVAANGVLRAALADVAAAHGVGFAAPPLSLCGDNGAMIAYTPIDRLAAGIVDPPGRVRSRWPLDASAATAAPLLGAGKRGIKA